MASFTDWSRVGDDKERLGKRKLKKKRISKECDVSLARTDLFFLLDELQYISVNGTIVSGGHMVPHITALRIPHPT